MHQTLPIIAERLDELRSPFTPLEAIVENKVELWRDYELVRAYLC